MLTLQDLRRSSRKLDLARAHGTVSAVAYLVCCSSHGDIRIQRPTRRLITHKNVFGEREVCVRAHVTAPVSKHDLLQEDSKTQQAE